MQKIKTENLQLSQSIEPLKRDFMLQCPNARIAYIPVLMNITYLS